MATYDNREMVKASYYYYKLGMTQEQIADKMYTSRQRINRILKTALDEDIVRIEIVDVKGNVKLEEELERKFHLRDSVVISPIDENIITELGRAGAKYLENILTKGDIIGTTWGNTVSEIAKNLSQNQDLNVSTVQLVGGMNIAFTNLSPEEITRTIAKKLGGKTYIPYAPVTVGSKNIKQAIMSDQSLKCTFKYMEKANIFLVGIGELNENTRLYREDEFNGEYINHLIDQGCVGDIGLRWFDKDGNAVEHKYNKRTIGYNVLKDKGDALVIAIAGGENKYRAIKGALKGSHIDVLITDSDMAKKLLED